MTHYLVRINGRDADTFASLRSVAHAADKACAAPYDQVEYAVVFSTNGDLTTLKNLAQWKPYLGVETTSYLKRPVEYNYL